MQGKVSRTWIAAFVFALSAIFVGQSLADDVIPPVVDPVVEPATLLPVEGLYVLDWYPDPD